uniref:Pm52 protein n=1 Tax=Cannabis sativa TaxID=3483 RepID=A0A803NSP7_CANSA
MAKFNVIQKKKRAQTAERKRAIHGDPSSRKLKVKPQNQSVSGKRKRKLLKKWRRDQKEAAEKGLLTMQDVEMAAADGEESSKSGDKSSTKFPMKRALKLKQQLKHKGKGKNNKKSGKAASEAPQASADAMVE